MTSFFFFIVGSKIDWEKKKSREVVNVFLHCGIVSVSRKYVPEKSSRSVVLGGKLDHPCFRTWS